MSSSERRYRGSEANHSWRIRLQTNHRHGLVMRKLVDSNKTLTGRDRRKMNQIHQRGQRND